MCIPPTLYNLIRGTSHASAGGDRVRSYRGADKSLVRPGRKQALKHVRDARDFNNIETRAVVKFCFLQGKAQWEIHAILRETLACFLPGRAKDLSASLSIVTDYFNSKIIIIK